MHKLTFTLDNLLKSMAPAIEGSLDGICMLNRDCEIVYANAAARHLLKLRVRDIKLNKVFCDIIKLSCCSQNCQIDKSMKVKESIHFDELPVVLNDHKMRIMLKGIPLFGRKDSDPVGILLTIRDTTAEVLVQAKYHKLAVIMKEKQEEIDELKAKLRRLFEAMRSKSF